jgi:AcrR family transcriptional regulator
VKHGTQGDGASASAPPVTRRMPAKDREESILRGATTYFAENGLGAGTTELARRLHIAQPLLYRYFPSKDALVDGVYERLAPEHHWRQEWEQLLEDTTIPLRERLKRFYADYAVSVLTYEHVRLFLFSGLTKNVYNTRYYEQVTERILRRVALALRHEYGDGSDGPVTPDELELAQSLHGAVYHIAFRRWVHSEESLADLAELARGKVDVFLDGAATWLSDGAANGSSTDPDRERSAPEPAPAVAPRDRPAFGLASPASTTTTLGTDLANDG